MSASSAGDATTLGGRIQIALDAEGRKQTSLEQALIARGIWTSRGTLSSYISGRRGTQTVDNGHLAAIADVLHVNFEWLALGRGPMRRDGRVEQTPAEQAIQYARLANCRDDAIDAAWEKNKDQLGWSVFDWIAAIQSEAMSLNARGVPRPEVVTAAQAKVRKQKKKLENARELAREDANAKPVVAASRRRASGL